jgi:hypothetical protein
MAEDLNMRLTDLIIRLIQNMAVGAVVLFFLIAGCVSQLFSDEPKAGTEVTRCRQIGEVRASPIVELQ